MSSSKAQTEYEHVFFPGNNRMFRINAPFVYSRGRLIEGSVYFKNFEKGRGVYLRGRLKEGGV